MKAIEKLREVAGILQSSGFDSPVKEAEILISRALDLSTLDIYRDDPYLDKDSMRTFEDMLERRLLREPSQYITGYEEFMGLKLAVGPGVLIPRPETEIMAEQAIKTVKSYKLKVESEKKNPSIARSPRGEAAGLVRSQRVNRSLASGRSNGPRAKPTGQSSINILDVCTGSGCLALALAKEFPGSKVFGTDISEAAVAYAERNAEINGIKNATFLQGDLFEPVHNLASPACRQAGGIAGSRSLFDLIISNPPYIKTGEIRGLQPEIRDWEPMDALNGGADGLDHYRKIIPEARKFLNKRGMIMLEIGQGQEKDITEFLDIADFEHVNVIRDYAGIKRIIQAQCRR